MKILVIHATAGAGHKKAAEAVYDGLLRHTTHHVKLVDALDLTSPFFKSSYAKTYVFLVTHLSFLWGFFFWLLDIPIVQPLVRWIRKIYNGMNTLPLQDYLKKENFDVVITTHFMAAQVCGHLKGSRQIQSRIICVVTDFDVHRIWINKGVDCYTAATEYTRDRICSLGISPDKVFATGIPTDEKFSLDIDKKQIRQQLQLKTEPFTILVATGSFGIGPIEELISALSGYQLLIVCGHNRSLYEKLRSRKNELVHVLGLVHNMPELMSAADVMVTKPGGLSVAEALVKKLPLIFFSAIPGQETGNIKVLVHYQAAQKQGTMIDIVERVDDLNYSPDHYQELRQKMLPLSKPQAVKDIIKLIGHRE
jgi:processive 1,2-diacylglycerol beta-glucosyltransferase